jgi:8-oxo-dGTP pyrophosphatase MutT (NUDIX family)
VIVWDIAGVRFNFRVAGVFIEDGHVLLHRIAGLNYWFLPGGRVEVRETSDEALRREMHEELGTLIHIERLLWVVESFFEEEGRSFHELGLYYAAALPAGSPYSDKGAVYQGVTELGHEMFFQWFRLDVLDGLNLVPPFLKEGLLELPYQPQLRIERE